MDWERLPVAPLYADVRAYCSHVKMYCKRVRLLSSYPRLFIHWFMKSSTFALGLTSSGKCCWSRETRCSHLNRHLTLAISLATTFFSFKDRAIRNLKFGDKTTIMFLLKVFIDKNIHIDDYTVSNKNVIRVTNSPSSKLRLPSFSVRRLTVNCGISELARST